MYTEIATVIGAGVVRSLGGWAQHAFADGKVTLPELKKLAETVVRVGIISVAGFYAINGLGIDINILATSAGAIVADKLFSSLENNKNVKG